MYGKIRELFDRSKFLDGSALKVEADTMRHLAKKRLVIGLQGAFAAGKNFIGKIRADGRADILEIQPDGVYGVNCRIPQDPRSAFHYKIPKGQAPAAPVRRAYPAKPKFTLEWTLTRYRYKVIPYIGGVDRSTTRAFDLAIKAGDVYVDQGAMSYTVSTNGGGSYYNNAPMQPPSTSSTTVGSTTTQLYQSPLLLYTGSVSPWGTSMTLTATHNIEDYPIGQAWLQAKNAIDEEYAAALANYYAILADLENRGDTLLGQLNDGELIFQDNSVNATYASIYYPDDVTPRLPPSTPIYFGYDNHVIRHRAWRLTQDAEIRQQLDLASMPKNLALAIMHGAPWSKCVGIGSRWINYRVAQTSSGSIRYDRTLYARDILNTEVVISQGYCQRTTVSTAGVARYEYEFVDFPVLRPLGFTAYLNGTYSLTSPEILPLNPELTNGDLNGVTILNGTYDSLSSGLSDLQAQSLSNAVASYVPTPAPATLTFSAADLSALLYDHDNDSSTDPILIPDILTYDKDLDGDGTIETSEKSPTSERHWLGKGLSTGERLTIIPLSYIAQDGECGMFPQDYDTARLVGIRVYGFYRCKYLGEGEFSVGEFQQFTDESGEPLPYVEFPYTATSMLGGFNAIVVANGTVYDDVLDGRKAQATTIDGAYEEAIAAGNITLNGLYEWCKLNT